MHLLTDRARKVMELAAEQAVNSMHMLFGLIKEGGGVAVVALENLGIVRTELLQEIESYLSRPTNAKEPSTIQILNEHATEEARLLDNNYIDTNHLLLALLRNKKSAAAQLLASHGITVEAVRREIQRIFEEMERARKERVDKT